MQCAVYVYRKPTHIDRYLDFNSHHDNLQKASTASTLLHRALSLPNSSEGIKRELNYVHAPLESNGYPSKFIRNIQAKKTRSSTTNVSPEELVGMFFKMVEPTESRKSFASLPTLGSRGYFFLIDISRRSRVNESQSAEEKKITSGHRSTQPHFHARSG